MTTTIRPGAEQITVYPSGYGVTIFDRGAKATYDVLAGNSTLHLAPASASTIELGGWLLSAAGGEDGLKGMTITGWVTGRDHLSLAVANISDAVFLHAAGPSPIAPIDNDAATPKCYLIDLGRVGTGSAAAVAALAAKAYTPSTTLVQNEYQSGPEPTDSLGVYFAGTTKTGNTTVYAFTGDAGGTVTAADLVHLVTLIGVKTLTTADIAIG